MVLKVTCRILLAKEPSISTCIFDDIHQMHSRPMLSRTVSDYNLLFIGTGRIFAKYNNNTRKKLFRVLIERTMGTAISSRASFLS